jgi:hypothetical protein
MRKNLGLIAVIGFAASVVFLAGAWLMSGKANWSGILFRLSAADLPSCGEENAGRAASRALDWDGSERVGVAIPAIVHYRPGSAEKLVVAGDASLVPHIRVSEGEIKLDCQPARGAGTNLDITLPGTRFRSFSLSGITSLMLSGIDQPELHLNIAGSSTVSGAGRVNGLFINAAGKSDARLGGLATQNVELNLAGASTAEISATDKVEINSVGATTVTLVGEPKSLKTNIIGSGRILRRAL